jgi:transcriptional regulator with XRE-family HTH domain
MTAQQFADAVGVTRAAVQQWEKEGGTAPSRKHQPAVLKLIATAKGGAASVHEMIKDLDEQTLTIAKSISMLTKERRNALAVLLGIKL